MLVLGGGGLARYARLAELRRGRAELALRESAEEYDVTFEQAAVGILHAALDGLQLTRTRVPMNTRAPLSPLLQTGPFTVTPSGSPLWRSR